MRLSREIRIFLFSISLLSKRKSSFFIFFILTFLIFTVSSASFIVESIKKELMITHDELPDIVVQKVIGGRQQYINIENIDKIVNIPGIKNIVPRIWGYYFFEYSNINFSVIGIDPLEPFYKRSLEEVFKNVDLLKLSRSDDWMILGDGISNHFKKIGYLDASYFKKPDGSYLKLIPYLIIDKKSAVFTNDMVFVSKKAAKAILGLEDEYCTDIAINVYNKNEVVNISSKIRDILKDVRTINKMDVLNSYQNVFNYKSGFFITLFGILIFNMIIIVVDKLSGLSESEKIEIGILKATGWTTGDILKLKFYESSFFVLQAYIIGLFLAMIYVFIFKAPLMINIFSGYGSLKLNYQLIFAFNFKILIFIFLSVVPFYLAAVLIPSYKVAVTDVYEVFK